MGATANLNNLGGLANTCNILGSCVERPRKLTAREVDETFEGDIPETSYADLPPNFNEVSERKRLADVLFNERVDNQLSYFYKAMNETAYKHGLSKSNWAVAHGMHHNNNVSSALDIAKLSRIALAQHALLVEIVNTKTYDCESRLHRGVMYNWKNTNFILWSRD